MKVSHSDIVNVLCCPPDPAVPDQYSCLWPQILRKYRCLLQRHQCMFTKRPRIHELAVPTWQYKKYERPCLCDENMKRNIEIIHLHKREPTRTVQLAYPAVRKFKQLRNSRFYKSFDQLRRNVVNRNQRLSQLSLYTYLGNSSIYCQKKKREPALSKKRKAKLLARLAELALPVLPVEPPPPERGEASSMSQKRLDKLATPNPTYDSHEKPEWHLTKGARKYKASEAILRMSKPVKKIDTLINPDWDKIQPKALKYKASTRIKEMATPKPKPTEDSTFKKDPFAISPKALKYNPSNRIKEMAEPKDFSDVHNKQDPFAVSAKALRAKCSKRLAEMAKPKEYA